MGVVEEAETEEEPLILLVCEVPLAVGDAELERPDTEDGL